MRKIKWLTFVVILVIAIVIILFALINDSELPIYHEINNVKSDTPNFVKNYVVKGNQRYVSDITESCMDTTGLSFGKAIGVISGGGKIYSLDSNNPPNYIVLTGFMSPSFIYRNESIPMMDFLSSQVSEIQLKEDKGFQITKKKTKDKKIISEVQSVLRNPKYVTFKGSKEIYHLTLFTPKISGIGFMVYVAIDKEKNVYMLDQINQKPIKAGPLFTDWLTKIKD